MREATRAKLEATIADLIRIAGAHEKQIKAIKQENHELARRFAVIVAAIGAQRAELQDGAVWMKTAAVTAELGLANETVAGWARDGLIERLRIGLCFAAKHVSQTSVRNPTEPTMNTTYFIEPERLYSEVDAARLLTISPRTMQKWRQLGRGPSYAKFGRVLRYPGDALLDFRRNAMIKPRNRRLAS